MQWTCRPWENRTESCSGLRMIAMKFAKSTGSIHPDHHARQSICRQICNKIEKAHSQAWVQRSEALPTPTILKTAGVKRCHDQVSGDEISSTNVQVDLKRTAPATPNSYVQSIEDNGAYDQGIPIDPALLVGTRGYDRRRWSLRTRPIESKRN